MLGDESNFGSEVRRQSGRFSLFLAPSFQFSGREDGEVT